MPSGHPLLLKAQGPSAPSSALPPSNVIPAPLSLLPKTCPQGMQRALCPCPVSSGYLLLFSALRHTGTTWLGQPTKDAAGMLKVFLAPRAGRGLGGATQGLVGCSAQLWNESDICPILVPLIPPHPWQVGCSCDCGGPTWP